MFVIFPHLIEVCGFELWWPGEVTTKKLLDSCVARKRNWNVALRLFPLFYWLQVLKIVQIIKFTFLVLYLWLKGVVLVDDLHRFRYTGKHWIKIFNYLPKIALAISFTNWKLLLSPQVYIYTYQHLSFE